MDEPTAWDDINPPMVSAQRHALPTEYSEKLRPASAEAFRDELTACLALVAPVGMAEEARGEWLAVAWATLKDLPPDILAAGCRKARETCDHPSKIVPTIIAETEGWLANRRDVPLAPMIAGPRQPRTIQALLSARGEPMTEDETERLNKHLEWAESPVRYYPDGSKAPQNKSQQ